MSRSSHDKSPRGLSTCEVCGIAPKEHPRCNGCGVLVGNGHFEGLLYEYNGLKLCGSCYKAREQFPNLEKQYSDFWE